MGNYPEKVIQPFFSDFGKNCSGVLNSGYVHNFIKIDVRFKSEQDVNYSFGAVHNLTTEATSESFEARYKFVEPKVTVAGKWWSFHTFGAEVTLDDYVTDNTKFSGEITLKPEKKRPPPEGEKSGTNVGPPADAEADPSKPSSTWLQTVTINKVFRGKGAYKNEYGTVSMDGELNSKGGPYLKGSATAGHKYFTTGVGLGYDFNKKDITERKIGCQMKPNGDENLAVCLWYNINGSVLIASGYCKLDNVECGCTAQWSFSKNELGLGIGTKYKMSDLTTLRAKLDERANVMFGFTQKMKEGFNITMSTMINCLDPANGSLSIGAAFEINL